MVDRTTRLRWRRRIRKHRRQVEEISENAEHGLEVHVYRRFGRLANVWRFTAGWISLLVLVAFGTILQIRAQSHYYQTYKPVPGGTYVEGIIGIFTTASPLYASSAVDQSVSKLIFPGLLKYDRENKLTTDLAESIKADASGKVFTVTLRPNIFWHDGKKMTARDVVFTYQTIKNPDVRSPFFNTWKDIKVTAKDSQTVVFELPNILSTFREALTNGIVPEHILKSVEPSDLRTSKFNTANPVGTGPFKWNKLEVTGNTQETRQEAVGLTANTEYYKQAPKLSNFVIRTFRTESQMIESYKDGELTAMVGLASIPDDVRETSDFHDYYFPIMGSVMVFFKTTKAPFDDVKIRRALVQSVNTNLAIDKLGNHFKAIHGPLLDANLGLDDKITQLQYNKGQAKKYLDEAGWKLGEDGLRYKDKKPLTFTLYAQSSTDYSSVTSYLQKAWKEIGVKAEVLLQSDTEIQSIISRHDYDALLYGISIGNDPDVFAYWHSSQALPSSPSRLNFSEYKSKEADAALEAGRTRIDPKVRASKYKQFLKIWREDAPALALYQPSFIYVTRGKVYNFAPKSLSSITNRYTNIENWMIYQEKVNK